MNPYTDAYRTQQIQTATQEQLLIMLYEGAIRFLNLSKAGYEEKNLEKYHTNITKAQRIIMEFMTTLDLKMGGEMAKNLFSLYEYLHYQLMQANLKKNVSMIDEVLMHLRDLKATWEEAIGALKQEESRANRQAEEEEHVYSA